MRFEDTVALVTGGASGLGEGVVRMIAQAGGRAAILDLPKSRGTSIATELGQAVTFFELDVTDAEQVGPVIDAATDHFGTVNLLVSCAGVSPASRTVDRTRSMFPLEVFKHAVDVNLVGLFDVVRHAARRMAENEPGEDGERGLIVNVASIAGIEGQVGQTAYSASKGGVIALTLPLARDLSRWGIRVMTIAPGIMDTAMLAGADDKLRERLTEVSLFPKRLGRPDDFARLVRCFMEDTFLNGEVVRLDAATRLSGR
jgi:3-hydroxyacyl-CoA dehydrogenase / 3-hydroxy-2-methylbutyryl-CoA dehydrogenase